MQGLQLAALGVELAAVKLQLAAEVDARKDVEANLETAEEAARQEVRDELREGLLEMRRQAVATGKTCAQGCGAAPQLWGSAWQNGQLHGETCIASVNAQWMVRWWQLGACLRWSGGHRHCAQELRTCSSVGDGQGQAALHMRQHDRSQAHIPCRY